MKYRVELAPAARRQMKKLSAAIQKRITGRLRKLAVNPRPSGMKKLSDEHDLYRVRVGDYRIIYTIRDEELIVLVVKIGDRKRIY